MFQAPDAKSRRESKWARRGCGVKKEIRDRYMFLDMVGVVSSRAPWVLVMKWGSEARQGRPQTNSNQEARFYSPSSETLPTVRPVAGERLLLGMCSLMPLHMFHSPDSIES